MAQKRFRTNYRLWAILTGCFFILLGYLDLLSGANWKADYSFWADVDRFVRGAFACDSGEYLAILLFKGFLLAMPSILSGWVVQAIVVVRFSNRSSVIPIEGSCDTDGGTPQQ